MVDDGAGIGLRAAHYREILEREPALAFLEVHAENFFAEGGQALAWLERFRERYPLSVHGVGLSLGSAEGVEELHLAKLERLVRRFEPALVSEHLSWSAAGGRHANELLPLPFTREALSAAVANIQHVQERLGRPILVENVSTYLRFGEGEMAEHEFVAEVVRRAGCGLLLDVNNIHVNARNHGFDARGYLEAIDPRTVGEIHLAGHEAVGARLVDTHGARVAAEVWDLYAAALARLGPRPTLVEWDIDIPPLDVLLDEAAIASRHLAAAADRRERSAA
ncbi:MAG TPA: DUF692 domain-containing protein [Usitatibacter sp.]|nr:DUF692 domain-containing protein [Usitatibacter sp.]